MLSCSGGFVPFTAETTRPRPTAAISPLFLGSGTATFGTSDIAVASLLVAFYPLFPANVQDNRSHLQAFRHFWVLATESRCLVTKDLITDEPLNVPILIRLNPRSQSAITAASQTASDPTDAEAITLRRQTPCLLPPLDDISRVETDAKALGYWDLTINFAQSPELKDDFHNNQTVYLRRRPADEGTFPATLRALASSSSRDCGALLAGRQAGGPEPLEWVFSLGSLGDLSRAERDVVLDRFGSGGGVGEGEGASTAVDATLVLRAGLDGGCWTRDRLLGLRLLFEWAEKREMFAGQSIPGRLQERQGEGVAGGGKVRRGKDKGKKTASGRGRKKVSLGVAQHEMELQGQGD